MSEAIKSRMKTILPASLFILATLFLVYLIVSPSGQRRPTNNTAINISAEDLSSAFSANDSAAADKFNDKVVRVSGTIAEIGSNETGQPYVSLQGAGTGKPDLQCVFPGSDVAPIIQSFKKGQTMTLEGVCDGIQDKIVLRGCRIP